MSSRRRAGTPTTDWVFTHDPPQVHRANRDRNRSERLHDRRCTGEIKRLLVPLSGDVAVAQIVGFVTDLIDGREIAVTLLRTSADGQSDQTLKEAADELIAAGIGVTTRSVDSKPLNALNDAVAGHDAIVMGERAPSLASFVFGDEAERVAAASVGPVVVVRDTSGDSTVGS